MPKFRDAVVAVGGMVLGTLVGTGVQQVLARTGVLGPGVDSLIAEQQANFVEVNSKLDTLRQVSNDPAAQRALTELRTLLTQQGALATQTEQQLKLLSGEVAASKERELAERGMSGGADFWLKLGESMNLRSPENVFALRGYAQGLAIVNLGGAAAKRLAVGDAIDFKVGEDACKVFYKQATPRADGRIGFDVDCK
ncbi:MAG TPA: hypothetical protein VM692_10905 [Gammaproteobacteria bacterium]|nr:hypothetical protein [Gammaproteobacteria bacterium]